MSKTKLDDKIKKNLLDLQYNKYLQYYTTTMIILFTYFIGVAIAVFTNQIDYGSFGQFSSFGLVSLFVISILTVLLLNFKNHLKEILKEVKKLKI